MTSIDRGCHCSLLRRIRSTSNTKSVFEGKNCSLRENQIGPATIQLIDWRVVEEELNEVLYGDKTTITNLGARKEDVIAVEYTCTMTNLWYIPDK